MTDREHLAAIAAFAAVFEAPGFSFGTWSDTKGAMPYYIFSPEAEAFLAAVRATGWITPFDWGAWMQTPEGRALSTDPGAIASADIPQLGRLMTAIIRSERFSDGSIAGAFERGLLTAVARRAAVLRGA